MADKKRTTPKKFSFRLSDRKKRFIVKTTGALLLVVSVLSFLSFVSYFFTWKADYSLIYDTDTVIKSSSSISNWGSSLGFKWAHLLVGKWLGAAALVLLVPMVAGVCKIFKKGHVRFLRVCVLSLTGMYILALLFSFIGIHASLEYLLPAGLGGDAGAVSVRFLEDAVKPVVTALILAILVIQWLSIARPSFFDRLSSVRISLPFRRPAPAPEDNLSDEGQMEKDPVAMTDDASSADTDEDIPEIEQAEEMIEEQISIEETLGEKPSDKNENLKDETIEGKTELVVDVDRTDGYNTHVTEELLQDIDYKDKMSNYHFPSLDLLGDYSTAQHEVPQTEIDATSRRIQTTLRSFKIEIVGVTAIPGPTVTLYKLKLGEGVKISQVKSLQEDLGVSLGANGVRVVKLSDSLGIEVANVRPSIVPLKSMLADDAFRSSKAELPIAIGYTISREVKTFDLADAPHLLVAGATKMGKSVGLNVIITSLLYAKHPSELKFVFVDPKMVEFTPYASLLNHYLAVLPNPATEQELKDSAIAVTQDAAEKVLQSLVQEMEDRYQLMRLAGVNQVKLYNQKYIKRVLNPNDGHKYMPYLVAVIDEYADLTMSGFGPDGKAKARRISDSIIRLAQKGRAAGLHVIIATQRPSVNVVTPLIKTNFPMRIAFRVVSRGDSETILGTPGAEKLIGKGDMLLYAGAAEMQRVQCAFVSGDEITNIAQWVGNQTGYKESAGPFYLPEPPEENTGATSDFGADGEKLDPRFEEAARLVVELGKASTTEIQRKMGLGYAKAARIMDQLQAKGIVGPQVGARPREVLVSDFQQLQAILDVSL
ncbi:MAG: DNA translocase FtsK [Bacteroidales bacterium]|nr:DNA translocase FtsK [Bacteroidales bacterium]